MYQTRLGLRRVMTEGDEADVLAMNQQAWIEEHEDLCAQAAIVHEATVSIPSGGYARFPIPAEEDNPGARLADRQELRLPRRA